MILMFNMCLHILKSPLAQRSDYKRLKTKEKSSWVIPKIVAVAYERVLVTGASRLREWLQGELRLYIERGLIREIKIHVYRIRQTANVSGEFLRIENKQLKKVQNDSCGQN